MKRFLILCTALFCLLPLGVAECFDCSRLGDQLRRIQDDEKQLLIMLDRHPECADTDVALANYYFDRQIWLAAEKHYAKALEQFPYSNYIKERLAKAKEKSPLTVSNKAEMEEAHREVRMRALKLVDEMPAVAPLIRFETNSSKIEPDGQALLDNFADMIRQSLEKYNFIVQGHTDNLGDEDYNLTLSKERAKSVRNYLMKQQGIAAARFTVEGYGYSRPIDTNLNEAGRRNNRRVQFEFHLAR